MSAAGFRWAAAALLTLSGFCAGNARRQHLTARRRTLEAIIALLTRLRQEIAYRRRDLDRLYQAVAGGCGPGDPLAQTIRSAGSFRQMAPPAVLRQEEADCFAACFAELGHADAKQECARLDYSLQRFGLFLEKAREEEQRSASLDCRLGIAAGAVLGMLIL